MRDSIFGYCSCCAGLFDCTTRLEESKKLIAAGTFWHDIFRVLPRKHEEISVRRAGICITMT